MRWRGRQSRISLRDVPRGAGKAFLPRAPAGVHSVRPAFHDGEDLVDLALLDAEGFGDLPRPGLARAGGDGASVRRLEGAGIACGVIEEYEREHDAAFDIHGDEAPV